MARTAATPTTSDTDEMTPTAVITIPDTEVESVTLEVSGAAELSTRVERLIRDIRSKMRTIADEKIQKELANLVRLLPDLPLEVTVVAEAEVMAAALLADPPKEALAKAIGQDLASRVGASPLRALGRGLAGAALVAFYVLPLLIFLGGESILGFPRDDIFLMVVAGAVGAMVSILARLGDFADVPRNYWPLLTYTAAANIFIGIAFSLFVYVMLLSGLIPANVEPSRALPFFAVLGFVAGFSERFVPDLIGLVEGRYTRLARRERRQKGRRQRTESGNAEGSTRTRKTHSGR